jgi:hypothetical protein
MALLDALRDWIDGELAAEGITPDILAAVDLEIEYSPVIPFCGGQLEHAVRVLPWGFFASGVLPDKFEVKHPLVSNPVDRETLKVMRARYLLARDAHYGPIVRRWFQDLHSPSRDALKSVSQPFTQERVCQPN